jgi:beta-N-acetylhexosaminidase
VATKPTLSQAIGRLLSSCVPSIALEPAVGNMLQDGTIGGITLFRENVSSLEQLFELIGAIEEASFHPPVISVDQEGGAVQRFDQVISPIPSAMALAATDKDELVSEITELSARQLKLLGINCCLAPVLDVLSNPLNSVIATRAFASEPATVARFAKLSLEAFLKHGIVPVGKHFPGHGSTREDSHEDLAANHGDNKNLWRTDLSPFRSCLHQMPAILVGHVWLSSVDPTPLPASLSRSVINGILRQYLNYDGLVISDDMTMKAVLKNRTLEEAILAAILAGNDHILMRADPEHTRAVHAFLQKAVDSGKLSMDRIAEANKRTAKLFKKQKASAEGTLTSRMKELEQSVEKSRSLLVDTSVKAVTLVRGKVPSITSGEWMVVAPNHSRYALRLAHHLNQRVEKLNGKRSKSTLKFVDIRYSVEPSAEEAKEIGTDCAERNCVFVTYRSTLNQGQFELGETISANAREKVHVAVDSPFDLIGLPDWENSLATLDPSELAMEAAARILLGEQAPTGTCPVDLNVPFSIAEKI